MKTKLLLASLFSFFFYLLSSQVPQGFNYQAVARDGSVPIVTPVKVRITIQSDANGGTTYWIEEHPLVTPNESGLFSLVIGTGVRQANSTVATFSEIDWSVTPKYVNTEIDYGGWKTMGASALWAVPYTMVAKDLEGPVEKLGVEGTTLNMEEALFEVKNKDKKTVFAVYNDGVRVYVDNQTKGAKGGFAIGGFGTDAAAGQEYFVVDPGNIRMYIDKNISPAKGAKGGFAIGGFGTAKGTIQDYLRITNDTTRFFINDDPLQKGAKGGFAVGGFGTAKGNEVNFLNVETSSSGVINPSQNRILWYPLKNAFLAGKVLVVHPDSVGTNSIAVGFESRAKGNYSQAFGYNSFAIGDYSTAIGRTAKAFSLNSFAFGSNARAMNEETYALGSNAQAEGRGSVAIGFNSNATGSDAFALGVGTQATGTGSFAIGFIGRDSSNTTTGNTLASQSYAVAIGMGAQSTNKGAFSIGTQTISEGYYSFALGIKTKSSGWYSLSTGYNTWASGNFSTAMGYGSKASGSHSVSIGAGANSSDFYSIAIGVNTVSSYQQSTSIGSETKATGYFSLAMGKLSTASGTGAVSIGYDNQASDYGTALGYQTTSSGLYSISSGFRTIAGGKYSFASGSSTNASGEGASAFGYVTKASGNSSFAAGTSNEAIGVSSASFGAQSISSGDYSFTAGYQTTSSGSNSSAFGIYSISAAEASFAAGGGTIAKGDYSTAFNLMTKAKPFASFVIGQNNDTTCSAGGQTAWNPVDPLFIIGNGTDFVRGNAFTVLKNGYTAIGHATPTAMLDVNGNGRFRNIESGAYTGPVNRTNDGTLTTATSDIHFKENINEINDALNLVLNLHGISFTWKSDPEMGIRIGFIAQEVEKILPELVFTNPADGYKGVNYAEMSAVLVEAVKEQQKIIESQKIELRSIKERLENIEKLVLERECE